MSIDVISESASLLDAMAMGAATLYYDNAVKYGIGKYPAGGVRKSRNWKKFMQIARICMAHKVPVDKFVNTAFLKTMERHSIVMVQDICSFDVKSVLHDEDSTSSSTRPSDLWNLLSCKLLDMVFSLEGGQNRIDLLDSTMYGFPAWFRVFSPHVPVERIIEHWGDLAAEELSADSTLDSFLKEKRPETYKLLKAVMEKFKENQHEQSVS